MRKHVHYWQAVGSSVDIVCKKRCVFVCACGKYKQDIMEKVKL